MPHHYPRSVVIGKFYPPHAGTIISRSTADRRGPHIAPRKAARGGPINKTTFDILYTPKITLAAAST